MSTALKARPTTYNGIEMRSRLEARVAAFLDERGIAWEYEPRAFGTKRGQYLPDFRLTTFLNRPLYLEVRGTVDDVHKLLEIRHQMEIVLASEPDATLAWGDAWGFEDGRIEWRQPVVSDPHWQDVSLHDLLGLVGYATCNHYRLPEWRR
jgi:hypothetical protein